LKEFFTLHSELKNNEFFVTSESYGGHYVPTVTKKILDYLKTEQNPIFTNFRGFLLGNPLTNMTEQTYGMIATFHGHALISDQQWSNWQSACMNNNMSSDACVNITNSLQTQNQDLFIYGVD